MHLAMIGEMRPLRLVLILVMAITGAVMISATKCYLCTSLNDDACKKTQSPDSSFYLDCARFTPVSGYNYTCARLEYNQGGEPEVTRTCLISNVTCEALEKLSPVEMTNCTICDTDFCNGS